MDISGHVIQFFGLFDWLIVVNLRKPGFFVRFCRRDGGCGISNRLAGFWGAGFDGSVDLAVGEY